MHLTSLRRSLLSTAAEIVTAHRAYDIADALRNVDLSEIVSLPNLDTKRHPRLAAFVKAFLLTAIEATKEAAETYYAECEADGGVTFDWESCVAVAAREISHVPEIAFRAECLLDCVAFDRADVVALRRLSRALTTEEVCRAVENLSVFARNELLLLMRVLEPSDFKDLSILVQLY